jgi:hypothetical protein
MAHVSPLSRTCHKAGGSISKRREAPLVAGLARPTDSGGSVPARAARELARLRFGEVCRLALARELTLGGNIKSIGRLAVKSTACGMKSNSAQLQVDRPLVSVFRANDCL